MKLNFKYTGTLLISTLVLMFFAFFDNFPILTNDSGTYISSAFTLIPPVDRPVFYGLFIRCSSLGASVWLTVFVQCLILSYVLIQFLRKCLPGIPYSHILAFISFLSFFTIGGWFASQLMPDIFVSIMVLAVTNYLFFTNSPKEKTLLLFLIFLSVLTHNSNYIIITCVALLILAAAFYKASLRPFLKKGLVLGTIGLASWIALCMSNFSGGQGFTTSNATHVFVMGKLVESGVLKTYLDKACPVKDYKICAYKDQLPAVAWEFHWDAPSPLQQTGGWAANKQEYNAIIADIFSRPKYYPFLMYKSIEATARQLTLTQIDGNYILPWAKFEEGTAAYDAVEKYFPHELNELKSSKQNIKTLDIHYYDNTFFFIIVSGTIIALFLIPLYSNKKKELYVVLFTFVLFILLNAFITATLSSVNARFNSRVIWLIPFFNSVFIYSIIRDYIERQWKRKGMMAG